MLIYKDITYRQELVAKLETGISITKLVDIAQGTNILIHKIRRRFIVFYIEDKVVSVLWQAIFVVISITYVQDISRIISHLMIMRLLSYTVTTIIRNTTHIPLMAGTLNKSITPIASITMITY